MTGLIILAIGLSAAALVTVAVMCAVALTEYPDAPPMRHILGDPDMPHEPLPVEKFNDREFDFNLARRELAADPLAREAANVVPGPWKPVVVQQREASE